MISGFLSVQWPLPPHRVMGAHQPPHRGMGTLAGMWGPPPVTWATVGHLTAMDARFSPTLALPLLPERTLHRAAYSSLAGTIAFHVASSLEPSVLK